MRRVGGVLSRDRLVLSPVNHSPPAPVEPPDELVEPPLIEPETELPPADIPPDELLPPDVVVV